MRYKRPRGFTADDLYHTPPDDILTAIGRIAVVSASIEDILHFIYWRYVDTLLEIAPILTADEKPTRLAEDILKMAVAIDEDPGRIQDLKDLFADFKELNEKRNKCVHWLWHPPRRRKGRTHRLIPPHYQSKRPPIAFTADELNVLADDLGWVELRMYMHALSEEGFDDERKKVGRHAHLVAPAPWLDRRRRQDPRQPGRVSRRRNPPR